MAKNMKTEEAREKLSAIVAKARMMGIPNNEFLRLASKRKLNLENRRHFLIYALIPLIIAIPVFGLHKIGFDFYANWINGELSQNQCAFVVPDVVNRIFRPPVSCSVCLNVTKVEKISGIGLKEFEENYAYSGIPVVITDATRYWTAPQIFSYNFFQELYKTRMSSLIKQKCQFFPYKTSFRHLGEFLNLTDYTINWTVPWYVGWSNCDFEVTEILRKHYQRPYFLPTDAEAKRLDWVFMGSKGYGAPMHIDNVEYPSWQAQLQGRKKWQLQPAPECFYSCVSLEVTVEPGEIIVLDTNRWFHSTEIVSDENSITIGAEFD